MNPVLRQLDGRTEVPVSFKDIPDADTLAAVMASWMGSVRKPPTEITAYGYPFHNEGAQTIFNNRIRMSGAPVADLLDRKSNSKNLGYRVLANELVHWNQGRETNPNLRQFNESFGGYRKYRQDYAAGLADASPLLARQSVNKINAMAAKSLYPILGPAKTLEDRKFRRKLPLDDASVNRELQSTLLGNIGADLMAALYAERNQPAGTRPR